MAEMQLNRAWRRHQRHHYKAAQSMAYQPGMAAALAASKSPAEKRDLIGAGVAGRLIAVAAIKPGGALAISATAAEMKWL